MLHFAYYKDYVYQYIWDYGSKYTEYSKGKVINDSDCSVDIAGVPDILNQHLGSDSNAASPMRGTV
jgi:hypothetical protein